jgi:hypothetical protein
VSDAEHRPPEVPPRPERPAPLDAQRRSRGSLVPVLMVAAPLIVMIIGLVAFTGRAGLLMLGVIATIPAFVLLHYLLWGRLLMKRLKDTPRDDED